MLELLVFKTINIEIYLIRQTYSKGTGAKQTLLSLHVGSLKITFSPFLNLFLLQVIRTRSECVECRTPYPVQPMRHRYLEKVAEELADLIMKKNKIVDSKPS